MSGAFDGPGAGLHEPGSALEGPGEAFAAAQSDDKSAFVLHTSAMLDTPPPAAGRYFDHNGSTPLHPSIQRLCFELSREEYGNSAAPHPMGRRAAQLVDEARERLADVLGAETSEIYFTSGGTESDNWALFGAAALRDSGHLIVSAIEHRAVLNAARELERRGFDLTVLQPHEDGAVHLRDVQAALRDDTFLVSIMWANNETGVCQPVREIGALCRERGILFHTDAVCAFGKLPVDVREVPCDLLSLSAHKFHAPKGVGLQYIRTGTKLAPLHFGCGHQDGLRSGSLNTVAIAAMAAAAQIVAESKFAPVAEIEARRQQLWNGLRNLAPELQRNGGGATLPNTLNVWFPGVPSAALLSRLAEQGFSVAAGASASKGQASHVLLAMGLSAERASESLRFSLGAETTAQDVEVLLAAMPAAIDAARHAAPVVPTVTAGSGS